MTSPALERYAFPLLPAETGIGDVIELGADWRSDRSLGKQPIVYGRPPLRKIVPLGAAVSNAVRRTAFIRRCKRQHALDLRAVHLLPPPPGTSAPVLGALRQKLLAGALVLLSREGPETALETVARAAGARAAPSEFHVPGDGGAVARIATARGPRILRLARRDEASDPAPMADALQTLEEAGVEAVPRLDGRGLVGDISWMTESLLPGTRPAAITGGLRAQLVAFCTRLPRPQGPPTAPGEDLDVVEQHFPSRAPAVQAIRALLADRLGSLSAIARHGDFWAGNFLTTGDELTGVIDWAAWHPAAAPGTDLVHLWVAGAKKDAGRELGEVWSTRPWRATDFLDATAGYWEALGIEPRTGTLDAVALAWWACWVAQSVTRHPGRARQRSWVGGNVEPVLTEVARL